MRILIHIGVGKTGTTTLQKNLFARHRGVLNIGRPYANETLKKGIELLRDDDEVDYGHSALARLFEHTISDAIGRAVVLSDETLVHPIHQSIIAKRLHAIVPEAHVLITIRSQYDLTVSYWAAHGRTLKGVPKPYSGKSVGFDEWFAFEAETRNGTFARLDYHRLYRIYAEVFGKECVHVMLYERLAGEPARFACDLAALLGVDETEMSRLIAAPPAKTRPTAANAKYKDLRAWLLPNVPLSKLPGGTAVRRALLEAGSPLEATLSHSQRELIRERFGRGNQALAATLGIDLIGLRYPSPLDEAQEDRDRRPATPASEGRA